MNFLKRNYIFKNVTRDQLAWKWDRLWSATITLWTRLRRFQNGVQLVLLLSFPFAVNFNLYECPAKTKLKQLHVVNIYNPTLIESHDRSLAFTRGACFHQTWSEINIDSTSIYNLKITWLTPNFSVILSRTVCKDCDKKWISIWYEVTRGLVRNDWYEMVLVRNDL